MLEELHQKMVDLHRQEEEADEEETHKKVEEGLGECAAKLVPLWTSLGQTPTKVFSGLPNNGTLCFSNSVMQALASSKPGLDSALAVTSACSGPYDESSTPKLLASFALCASVNGESSQDFIMVDVCICLRQCRVKLPQQSYPCDICCQVSPRVRPAAGQRHVRRSTPW